MLKLYPPVLLLILQLDIEGFGGASEGARGGLTVIAAVVVLVLKVIEEVKLIANSCNVHLRRRVWGGVLTVKISQHIIIAYTYMYMYTVVFLHMYIHQKAKASTNYVIMLSPWMHMQKGCELPL